MPTTIDLTALPDDDENDNDSKLNNDNNANGVVEIQSTDKSDQDSPGDVVVVRQDEIPFLVTQWLDHYSSSFLHSRSSNNGDNNQSQALERIQKATGEIAAAFSELGAFGETRKINLSNSDPFSSSTAARPAHFADWQRQWEAQQPQLPLLTSLVDAARKSTETAFCAATRHTNVLQNVQESNSRNKIQDSNSSSAIMPFAAASVMHRPAVWHYDTATENLTSYYNNIQMDFLKAWRRYMDQRETCTNLKSQLRSLQYSWQQQLVIRNDIMAQRGALCDNISAEALLAVNTEVLGHNIQGDDRMKLLDETEEAARNNSRVEAVLERQLSQIGETSKRESTELATTQVQALELYKQLRTVGKHSQSVSVAIPSNRNVKSDPNRSNIQSGVALQHQPLLISSKKGYLCQYLITRSLPLALKSIQQRPILESQQSEQRNAFTPSSSSLTVALPHKSVLYSRLSHAMTIDTHMTYPIYCLCLDRTGKYFITGSDDYNVRIFALSSVASVNAQSQARRRKRAVTDIYKRGAVLVCTLRGHAGVINDIDVSSDNAFIATASDDGNVRVWAMRDGKPIAILQGHVGGANMVSWSKLTPYRLVSSGTDGLARIWDIREACIKRHSRYVGKREEYRQSEQDLARAKVKVRTDNTDTATKSNPSGQTVTEGNMNDNSATESTSVPSTEQDNVTTQDLPQSEPLLSSLSVTNHEPATVSASPTAISVSAQQVESIPLPPLPLPAADATRAVNNVIEPARVTNNYMIGDGVFIVRTLQHGATLDERSVGPGTRARRTAVKVICIARCPIGGHFATGSDDGICRIWRDEDDAIVEEIDNSHRDNGSTLYGCNNETYCQSNARIPTQSSTPVSGHLLLTLKGHLSTITDLEYSYKGDRLLSASQKDGVVRIWSWARDPHAPVDNIQDKSARQPTFILIKLSNPRKNTLIEGGNVPRRRQRISQKPGASSASISCDVVTWLCDDTKIVTAQSEITKQNDIVPGSQYIFIWDSVSGSCLLGLADAHTMQCPLLIPHPIDQTILCSGGADGYMKLWDLTTGQCFRSYKNKLEYGAIDVRDLGLTSGFVDGTFTDDGMHIIMTDELGRVIVFDCLDDTSNMSKIDNSSSLPCIEMASNTSVPVWMKEQYFTNDYYDLIVERDGFCIEQGSELPPYLAPRGVRSSSSGTSYGDSITDMYSRLSGPEPLCKDVARWERQKVRQEYVLASKMRYKVPPTVVGQIGNFTMIIHASGLQSIGVDQSSISSVPTLRPDTSSIPAVDVVVNADGPENNEANRRNIRNSRLSSNYRWRDYTDVPDDVSEVDEAADADDEDFQLAESSSRRRGPSSQNRNRSDSDADADENLLVDEDDDGEGEDDDDNSRSGGRSKRRRKRADEDDSSSDEYDQIGSTNNDPDGPFVKDYEYHYFKLPSLNTRVQRAWLHRTESNSSYEGRKTYTPQVGDIVVYIPRAHYETIEKFPSLTAPWQSWPNGVEWPVVQCRVNYIRYRFPYKVYRTQHSIVALLSLEVTGVPSIENDESIAERKYCWPKCTSFVAPVGQTYVFEVSLFDSGCTDYVVPNGLYVQRLEELEAALDDDPNTELWTYYNQDDNGVEDGEFTSYREQVVDIQNDLQDSNDLNLVGSGYKVIDVKNDVFSTWEVSASNEYLDDSRLRTKLSVSDKKSINKALDKIRSIPEVDSLFLYPVDTKKYYDYFMRIEIPMDLSFIRTRLESDYYCCRESVLQDMRVIRDNCVKYNGEVGRISDLGRQLVEEFAKGLFSEEEVAVLQKEEEVAIKCSQTGQFQQQNSSRQRQETLQQSLGNIARRTRHSMSTLERLPSPPTRTSQRHQQEPHHDQNIARTNVLASSTNNVALGINDSRPGRILRSTRVQQRGEPDNEGIATTRPRIRVTSRATRRANGTVPQRRSLRSMSATVDDNTLNRATASNQPAQQETVASVSDRPVGRSLRLRLNARIAEDPAPYEPPSQHVSTASTHRAVDNINNQEHASVESSGHTSSSSSDDEQENASSDSSVEAKVRNKSATPSTDRQSPRTGERQLRSKTSTQYNGDNSFSDDENQLEDKSDSSDNGAYDDLDHDKSSDEASELDSVVPRRGQRSRRSNARAVSAKRSAKTNSVVRAAQTKKSGRSSKRSPRNKRKADYADLSTSDIDDAEIVEDSNNASEFDASDADEVTRPTAKSKHVNKKRRRSAPKKVKETAAKCVKVAAYSYEPIVVARWPNIETDQISSVAAEILNKLRDLDSEGSFEIPVSEAFPELEDAYLSVVAQPLDFRTIEENKLRHYSSIQELQDDLELVFNNCLLFNGPKSALGQQAITMLDSMKPFFCSACEKLNVLLPRRFGR